MLRRSTIQLLRFHFSFFLLPVYLFALSQAENPHWPTAIAIFFILHLLVYPASNGYNSYMDRDETPIGALASPLQPTKQLFWVTLAMDIIAIVISWFVHGAFALGILVYILMSRAYSYRGVRLKQYPIIGFLTVFIFQGAWIYLSTDLAVYRDDWELPTYGIAEHHGIEFAAVLSSFLIGALYPLTQIYQHEADRADGVRTISMLLGKRGTFIFSAVFFLLATVGMHIFLSNRNKDNHFLLFLLFLLPAVLFFLWWMVKVWQNERAANFSNSLRMNVLATLCTTAYFLTLNFLNH